MGGDILVDCFEPGRLGLPAYVATFRAQVTCLGHRGCQKCEILSITSAPLRLPEALYEGTRTTTLEGENRAQTTQQSESIVAGRGVTL